MMERQKYETYCFNYETKESEIFVCDCGRKEFKSFGGYYDNFGTVEEMLLCDCGIVYEWAYGDIVNKIDNGIDWLIERTEESFKFSSNLALTEFKLEDTEKEKQSLEIELNRIKESLEELIMGIEEHIPEHHELYDRANEIYDEIKGEDE